MYERDFEKLFKRKSVKGIIKKYLKRVHSELDMKKRNTIAHVMTYNPR